MSDFDAEMLLEQSSLLGLITREQVREARAGAADGSIEAMSGSLTRNEFMTSWQIEKIKKGEVDGFFFGGCKLLFHIAEGSFARVYRGRKMPGNQPVAVKVLRQRFVSEPGAIERFHLEAEHGIKLIHPNIVRTYEYGDDNQKYYMIMEYVEGTNLRDFLKIRGRLTEQEALPLIVGLAQSLDYANSLGVTHRDIKGTNILISNSGVAKLVDFGLATLRDEGDKKMSAAHGQRTVDYSALERTCGSPKGDPRSDIFFLGCVFYQMLTGTLPLPEVETKDMLAKMLKRSFGAIKPLSEHRQAPREGLCEIIETMMKIDLKQRYQTMSQAADALTKYMSSVAVEKPKSKAAPAPKRKVVDADYDTDSEDFELQAFETKAHQGKSLLCVEVQPEIQEAFRKSLSKLGYRVWLVSDPERAAERYRESCPNAVIFDADGLGDEALDAFLDMHEKAHDDGRDLAAVVLLGPRQHYLVSKLPKDDRLIVLTKPIKMKQVQDAVSELAPLD